MHSSMFATGLWPKTAAASAITMRSANFVRNRSCWSISYQFPTNWGLVGECCTTNAHKHWWLVGDWLVIGFCSIDDRSEICCDFSAITNERLGTVWRMVDDCLGTVWQRFKLSLSHNTMNTKYYNGISKSNIEKGNITGKPWVMYTLRQDIN